MKYSIINKTELHNNLRIDAEFYSHEYLTLEKNINSHNFNDLITYCSFVKKGIFDLPPSFYRPSGVPLIRTSEIKDPLIDFSTTVYLDDDTQKANRKTELTSGDIVFTKIGAYIGDVAILPQRFRRYNFSQNVTGLNIKKDEILSGFLLAYLLSDYGQKQISRVIMLSGQGKLELEDIKNIKIILVKKEFQKAVNDLILKAEIYKEKSLVIYSQAERILLSELNLLNWKPKRQLSFVKNYSDTKSSGRIDAEYFQPMYEEIIEELLKYENGYVFLGDEVSINDKNFAPKDEVDYKYIELANISANGDITGFIEALGNELPTRARRKVNTGDVIVSSIEGSLSSIALINDSLNNALCSTGFYVVNSNKINSETLLVFLKSKAGQLQLKKGCSGTILTAISKSEFTKLIVPKIVSEIQNEIKLKITEMYKVKALSNSLLNIAKRGVEMAIEKDEKTAQEWINSELKNLNIKL